MAESFVDLAARACESREPGPGLQAVAALRSRLDALEAVRVEGALRAGWSWSQVADALGVTKQAVHKKHAHRLRPLVSKGEARGPGPKRVTVTGRARQVVLFARREAEALGHELAGTDHVLLGILRFEDDAAARALGLLGVSRKSVRREVAALHASSGRGERPSADVLLAPETRSALEQSLREAVRLHDGHLGVEHVLLALLRDEGGAAVKALAALGVEPSAVEQRLEAVLLVPGLADQL